MPTYLTKRIKRKNTEVNDDEDYYEKIKPKNFWQKKVMTTMRRRKHTMCLPTREEEQREKTLK